MPVVHSGLQVVDSIKPLVTLLVPAKAFQIFFVRVSDDLPRLSRSRPELRQLFHFRTPVQLLHHCRSVNRATELSKECFRFTAAGSLIRCQPYRGCCPGAVRSQLPAPDDTRRRRLGGVDLDEDHAWTTIPPAPQAEKRNVRKRIFQLSVTPLAVRHYWRQRGVVEVVDCRNAVEL